LGFHYAIDIYAGILGAWLIWWVVGRYLKVRDNAKGEKP